MKKRIIIVNKSFETGGIQSALVNMSNELCKEYDVDLFIYNPKGIMRERLDHRVVVLEPNWKIKVLGMTMKDAISSKKIKIILFKLFGTMWSKLFNNHLPIALAFSSQKRLVGYDLAIAYHQEQKRHTLTSGFTQFVLKKTEAKKKVAWMHYDPSNLDLDIRYSLKDYSEIDAIYCVSKSIMENAKAAIPELKEKFCYCYNFVDCQAILNKSIEPIHYELDPKSFICYSACRLTKEKALVRAINCIAPILKEHKDVVWIIAGDGVERSNIEKTIEQNNVSTQVLLIGNQSNPYSYMKRANLVMNVSYHEAAPMVFLESKLLGVPVFATDTSSALEFAESNNAFYICPNSDEGIRIKFREIIEKKEEIKKIKNHINVFGNVNEQSLEIMRSLVK